MNPKASELFRVFCESEDPDELCRVYNYVNIEADEQWLPILREWITVKDNSYLREAAAKAIARIEAIDGLELLMRAFQLGIDECSDLDGLCTLLIDLVESNKSEAATFAETLSESENIKDRESAAWLLGFVSEVKGPDILISLATDKCSAVRDAARESLKSYTELK